MGVAGGAGTGGVVVAVIALALAAVVLDPRSWARPVPRSRVGRSTRVSRAGRGGRWVRAGVGGRWRGPRRIEASPSLGVLCTQVASRLRSGAGVHEAWRSALRIEQPDRQGGAAAIPWAPDGGADRDEDGLAPEVLERLGSSAASDAVLVACRLAVRCGTPLAEILDECAHGITEVEAADADRRRALAGPAATARLLVWLPVGSLLIGAGMGADPIGSVLAGGPAALAMVLGVVFLLAGRWWIRRLVRRAETMGGGR